MKTYSDDNPGLPPIPQEIIDKMHARMLELERLGLVTVLRGPTRNPETMWDQTPGADPTNDDAPQTGQSEP